MVENLVDVIKRILFVDDGVEEDAQGPNVLLLASIGFALKNLRGSVV